MGKNERIAAVVVSYNRKELLIKCIDALLSQSYQLNKIIIVDNASNNDVVDYLRIIRKNDIFKIIFNKKNIGGAGGFKVGISAAVEDNYDLIWTLDDDAIPDYNALEELINFKNNEYNQFNKLIVSSNVTDVRGIKQKKHSGNFSKKFLIQKDLKKINNKMNSIKVDYSSFVGLLIPKIAVEKYGLPRDDFFIWHDDLEYCLRLNFTYDIYCVLTSNIVHYDNLNENIKTINKYDKKNSWKLYYGIRNIILIGMQHGNKFSVPCYFLTIFLIKNLHVLFFGKNKLFCIKLMWKGLIDGITKKTGMRVDPIKLNTYT
ncbi:glycosyltransferase [Alicyclobacillus sp. TC]|uniref:glycosyltransferase n=1 Tax=Alicyclobacillus sp. TC TaxID=2606450 RepID=UPI0019349B52|nr:glycosyltransferase [Alicyclobacillus sp. TC]QRF24371.1 glycosyltransferase [Alicyclobacillus sp. TC]